MGGLSHVENLGGKSNCSQQCSFNGRNLIRGKFSFRKINLKLETVTNCGSNGILKLAITFPLIVTFVCLLSFVYNLKACVARGQLFSRCYDFCYLEKVGKNCEHIFVQSLRITRLKLKVA